MNGLVFLSYTTLALISEAPATASVDIRARASEVSHDQYPFLPRQEPTIFNNENNKTFVLQNCLQSLGQMLMLGWSTGLFLTATLSTFSESLILAGGAPGPGDGMWEPALVYLKGRCWAMPAECTLIVCAAAMLAQVLSLPLQNNLVVCTHFKAVVGSGRCIHSMLCNSWVLHYQCVRRYCPHCNGSVVSFFLCAHLPSLPGCKPLISSIRLCICRHRNVGGSMGYCLGTEHWCRPYAVLARQKRPSEARLQASLLGQCQIHAGHLRVSFLL